MPVAHRLITLSYPNRTLCTVIEGNAGHTHGRTVFEYAYSRTNEHCSGPVGYNASDCDSEAAPSRPVAGTKVEDVVTSGNHAAASAAAFLCRHIVCYIVNIHVYDRPRNLLLI